MAGSIDNPINDPIDWHVLGMCQAWDAVSECSECWPLDGSEYYPENFRLVFEAFFVSIYVIGPRGTYSKPYSITKYKIGDTVCVHINVLLVHMYSACIERCINP